MQGGLAKIVAVKHPLAPHSYYINMCNIPILILVFTPPNIPNEMKVEEKSTKDGKFLWNLQENIYFGYWRNLCTHQPNRPKVGFEEG